MKCRHAALLALLQAGCIKPPDVVIVDRHTALEEQAGGSFRALEEALVETALVPRPLALSAHDADQGEDELSAGVDDAAPQADASAVDALLTRLCIGEALDGTLIDTKKTCRGAVDVGQVSRLIERQNRNRWQIWRTLPAGGRDLDSVRRTWRAVHLDEVVCDGNVQAADGSWGPKACAKR